MLQTLKKQWSWSHYPQRTLQGERWWEDRRWPRQFVPLHLFSMQSSSVVQDWTLRHQGELSAHPCATVLRWELLPSNAVLSLPSVLADSFCSYVINSTGTYYWEKPRVVLSPNEDGLPSASSARQKLAEHRTTVSDCRCCWNNQTGWIQQQHPFLESLTIHWRMRYVPVRLACFNRNTTITL